MLFRLIISFLILTIIVLPAEAHKPNQAFFSIQETTQGIQVEAEFPWTLRNALLQFNPALEEAKTKREFENTFFDYLQKHFIIRNSAAEVLTLKSVKELLHDGHSHQNSYLLKYEGSNFYSIENTLSFSIYGNQENYHKVIRNNLKYEYITTKDTPIFTIESSTNLVKSTPWKVWLGFSIGGVVIIIYGIFIMKKA